MKRAMGLAILVALIGYGCMTPQDLYLTSDPDGASVWIRDKDYLICYIGNTPAQCHFNPGPGSKYYVKVFQDGYEPALFHVGTQVSGEYYSDLALNGWAAYITYENGWNNKWSLDNNVMHVVLQRKEGAFLHSFDKKPDPPAGDGGTVEIQNLSPHFP